MATEKSIPTALSPFQNFGFSNNRAGDGSKGGRGGDIGSYNGNTIFIVNSVQGKQHALTMSGEKIISDIFNGGLEQLFKIQGDEANEGHFALKSAYNDKYVNIENAKLGANLVPSSKALYFKTNGDQLIVPGTEFALGVGEKASLRPMSDKWTWLQVKKKAIAKKINSHSIDEAAPTDNIVLLVINPSSSAYDWTALQGALAAPPGIQLKFYAAPNIAPHLNADVTGVLRAAECFRGLRDEKKLDGIDGFLVCSFSDHPLTHLLRENTTKPAISILEVSITEALLTGRQFKITTTDTGSGMEAMILGRAELGDMITRNDKLARILKVGVPILAGLAR